MIPMFDYGNITEEHKAAAEECAKLVDTIAPHVSAMIRERFKIVEPKRLALEDTVSWKVFTENGFYLSQQGYMVGPDGVQIPMVSLCTEVTKLDNFLEQIKS